MTQGVKRTPPSLWYQAKEHLRYLVAMKGNLARSGHYSRANTPAGQRQSVLGVDAFAVEPNSVNDSHLLNQGWRRHVEIPNVSERIQHVPYSGHQYPDMHDANSFQSRFHLFRLRSPFKLTHSSHIDYIIPTLTVRYCGTYLCLLPLHAEPLNSAPSWPWWREVAVRPNGLPSMTIRVQGILRPIVVFPGEIGHPISILDVMNAVYNAVRTNVVVASDAGDSNTTHLIFRPGPDDGNQEVGSINAVPSDAIHRQFRGQVWWAGLRASTDEVARVISTSSQLGNLLVLTTTHTMLSC
ncbi:hypothetical protein BDN70DRAFT_997517 [Pholiota conissans]|uniref:Uncharacterized protein n=1 Tax=Pholiota conissans TaxID=109636 RepID=A0A9P5YS83_9AGAR|nr:hypothetical protein BDN70DRAFT_997517 [Pholiota conissans]